MFILYINEKPLLHGCWEDLESFVEEVKKLNPDFIDRRKFKIVFGNGSNEIFKIWNRK